MAQIKTRTVVWAVIAVLCAYCVFSIVTLDAYGQCRKPTNLWLCLDGWINTEGFKTPFKKLMTDEEMIERFHKHRSEFEVVVEDVQRRKQWSGIDVSIGELPRPELGRLLGLNHISIDRDFKKGEKACLHPHSIDLSSCNEPVLKWNVISLWADSSRLIDEESWPFSNLVKYYVYYPWEEPAIEGGRIVSSKFVGDNAPSKPHLAKTDDAHHAQLRTALDTDWPDGWPVPKKYPTCLMRRLEAHWYLKICKNDIGG